MFQADVDKTFFSEIIANSPSDYPQINVLIDPRARSPFWGQDRPLVHRKGLSAPSLVTEGVRALDVPCARLGSLRAACGGEPGGPG